MVNYVKYEIFVLMQVISCVIWDVSPTILQPFVSIAYLENAVYHEHPDLLDEGQRFLEDFL